MRRSVQACVNLVLVVTSVIAALLLGEVGCRLVGYTTPFRIPITGYYPRFYHKADPVNGYDIAENFSGGFFDFPQYIRTYGAPFAVSSNSLGCRDRPFDQENGYVLLLGDSLTWGYVSQEETWGATLEQLIGTRVLKCGVGGYGPRQERHKLETVVAKAGPPRLVIVGYTVANDLLDDYLYPNRTVIDGYMVTKIKLADAMQGGRIVYSDDAMRARMKNGLEQKPTSFTASMKDLLVDHSIVYNLMRQSQALRRLASWFGLTGSLSPPAPPSLPAPGDWEVYHPIAVSPWLDNAWEEHFANLRQLKSAVEAVGATLLVVLPPMPSQVHESLRPQDDSLQWEYPNKRLAEFFQRENIAFLDLLPDFRRYARHTGRPMMDAREDLFWPEDGHLNVKGNRLVGLLISHYVLQQPFLKDKEKRLPHVKQLLSAWTDVAP